MALGEPGIGHLDPVGDRFTGTDPIRGGGEDCANYLATSTMNHQKEPRSWLWVDRLYIELKTQRGARFDSGSRRANAAGDELHAELGLLGSACFAQVGLFLSSSSIRVRLK